MYLMAALLTAGCLGGGGSGSSSQQSLGSVQYIGHTVKSYDAINATIAAKGILNITGVTELNEIRIFTDSNCLVNEIGFGLHRDFAAEGIDVTLPSPAITDLYLSTNTSKTCFYFFQYVPKYDAPAAPTLGTINPTSPSRVSYRPYISGTVSPSTINVRFYLNNTCTLSAGQGTATQFSSTGVQLTLTPDSDNQIYGMAVDAFGKSSDCILLTNYLHDSDGPTAPVFQATNPVSPSGASTTPLIRGTVSAETQTVAFYTDAACSVPAGSGTAEEFRTTGIAVTTALNTSTSFYAIGTNDKLVPSDCTFMTVFAHDSVAPVAPVFVAITPTSPSRTTLVPKISGTAPADAHLIRLFNDATCQTMVGSGTKSVFEGAGIPTGVLPNEVTILYGQTMDAAGNTSSCTMLSSFEHDTVAPDPPVFGLSTPASPNNQSTTPRIVGTSDVAAINVKIYSNETCTTLIGSGTASAFESPGIQVTVTGNTTTTLYATSDDTAGNTSTCAALSNYSHSTVPAPAPGFFQATPLSPTRVTNRPYIIGTAANTITRVTLYNDAACTGSLGTASRSTFVTSGIQSTVATNAETFLYAISEDVYGNVSACTYMTRYIHNTVPPIDPIFSSVTPLSPNNQSTTPTIKGTLVFDAGNVLQPNEVSLYDGFLCLNKIGTGTPAQFQGAGLTASLGANTASQVYARVFDAAGNSSSCTYMTDYIHDALVPGRPILSSISPATPSYTSDTVMVGSIGPTTDFLSPTDLVVYTDTLCQNILKTAPVTQFTSGNYSVSFAKNSTTTLYGAIFNAVGTASPCTLLVNFQHSDVGPTGLASNLGVDGSVALNWNPDSVARPVPTYELRRSIQAGGPYTTIAENIVGTTYTDFAVSNGKTYYYVVAARNNTGVSKDSAEISRTISVSTPAQLLGLNAAPGPAQVTLNWLGASENMTYELRRSTVAAGPFTTIASKLSSTTYVDTSLTNGTTYYYVVTGTNPAGKSVDSNQASATPLNVPIAPANLELTQVENSAACGGGFGVQLTWTPSPYFSNFTINRGTSSSASTPLNSTGATTFTDCNPATGGTVEYNYYSITANWGSQQSAESNKVVFAYESSGNISVHPGNGQIAISWNVVPDAVTYRLYRSTSAIGTFTLLTSGLASTSYTDSAVSNGQQYFYYMQAEYPNDSAIGRVTPTVGAVPGVNPEAPTNLIVSVNSSRQPVLNWMSTHAFNFFRVYRAPSAGGPYTILGTSNSNSFTDSSPIVGMNYYRAVSVWGTSESAATNTVQVRIGYPLTVNITTSTTAANLSWTSVAGTSTYSILRGTSSGGPYTEIASTASLSYADTSAALNVGYFYVIQPNFADLTVGQYSNEVSGSLSNSTIPTGLTVTSTTQSSVALNWPRVSGATSYKIFRADTIGGPYLLVGQQATIGINITGLSGLSQHYFRYSFIRSGIESVSSASVQTYTWATPSAPIVTAGNNSIALSWGSVAGVSSYTVERSTDGTTFSTQATGLALPQYTDASVSNGVLYAYRIVAVFPSETRTSPVSTFVNPGLVPRAPAGLAITKNITGTDIELSWGPSAGATFYRIYRSTASGGPYTQVSQTASVIANNVTGHTAGTKYFFVVAAVIGSLESTYSNEVSIIPTLEPNAPLATVSVSNINVSWTAVAGATQYYLSRSTDRVNFSNVAGPIAGTTFSDTTALSGMSYSYRFQSIDGVGTFLAESLISADVTIGVSPEAPANLVATTSDTTSVSLEWTQVPNIVDYVVYRSTVSGGPYTQITTLSSTSFTNTGLVPGTTYFFVVSSRDVSGNLSIYSNQVSVRLSGQPINLAATANSGFNQLTWDVVGGASGYSVYRSLVSGGPYGLIAQNLASASYQDSSIRNGVLYYYVVRAEFGSDRSPQSTQASATGIRRMNLQVPIELVDQSLSSDTVTRAFARTTTTLDTDNYDGAPVYEFEAVVTNADSSARNVRLVDESNNVVGSLVVPANTTDRSRIRTTFTPTNGDHRYRVQIEGSTGSGQLEVATARILVTQTAASKTAIYIPLLSSSAGAYIGDESGPISTTNSSTYDSLPTASIYRREASKYAELVSQNPWQLETLVSTTGTAVGAVALYNITRSAHVDDTESIVSGTSVMMASSPFQEGVTGFSTANELDSYQVAIRCVADCQTGLMQLYKAGLWVRLENLDKAQVHFRNGLGAIPSGLTHFDQQRTLIDTSKFSNPFFYFQSTATITAGMDAGQIWLSNIGTSDSGLMGPATVTSSTLTINSNTKSLYRSPAVAPTTLQRYIPSADPGTSMLQITDTSIVVEATQ